MKSLKDQLACAQRELAMRRNVYKRWVATNRMTGDKARDEIGCMEAIVDTLSSLLDGTLTLRGTLNTDFKEGKLWPSPPACP